MSTLATLRRRGILGINRRNASYTLEFNPRRFYPRVDDKLETKRLCAAAGIPTPRLLAVVERHSELRSFMRALRPYRSFVVKPARETFTSGSFLNATSASSHSLAPLGAHPTPASHRASTADASR